jgi:hypothetical protein
VKRVFLFGATGMAGQGVLKECPADPDISEVLSISRTASGYIQPLDGILSKQKFYRVIYMVVAPLYPLLKTLLPRFVATTRQVGLAMIWVAKQDSLKKILTNADMNPITA